MNSQESCNLIDTSSTFNREVKSSNLSFFILTFEFINKKRRIKFKYVT